MGRLARRGFVFMLAMALIAGGLPLAHAMPCASSTYPAETVHRHDGMQMVMVGAHLHAHGESQASPQQQHRHDGHGKAALDVCKCLNCGMCAMAYAAPMREGTLARRAFAVDYSSASIEHPTTLTFVDPGIPIATA
jgi:hypothetical protein